MKMKEEKSRVLSPYFVMSIARETSKVDLLQFKTSNASFEVYVYYINCSTCPDMVISFDGSLHL